MKTKLNAKPYAGFTLLEVLVALVIVAVALTATMKTTGDITNSSFYIRQKVFAHWIAQNQLAELTLTEQWPSKGNKKDIVEFAEQEWEWEQTVSETPYKDIHKVEIAVRNLEADDDADPLIRLVSYSLNPQLISSGDISSPIINDPNNNNRRDQDRNEDRNSEERRPRNRPDVHDRDGNNDLRDRDEYSERNDYDDERN